MRRIDLIVIHCSATPNGLPVSVDTIRSWHQARGFEDIGYHYLVYIDGRLVGGRPEAKVGAHALGHNANSIGVCMVGGIGGPDSHNPGRYTPAQWEALRVLVQRLQAAYPGAEVVGHRDLSPDLDGDGVVEPEEWIKLCPSFEVKTWLAAGMQPAPEQILETGPC